MQNPIYYGAFSFNGEIYGGTREPIISKKFFDSVQQVMSNRWAKKRRRKYEFAFSGLMKYGNCACLITAEKQKGDRYYRCTTKKKQLYNEKYLREENLVEQMKGIIQKVPIPNEWRENMVAELDIGKASIQSEGVSFVQNLKSRKMEVEQKTDRLLGIYIESGLAKEEISPRNLSYSTRKPILSKKSEILNKKEVIGLNQRKK